MAACEQDTPDWLKRAEELLHEGDPPALDLAANAFAAKIDNESSCCRLCGCALDEEDELACSFGECAVCDSGRRNDRVRARQFDVLPPVLKQMLVSPTQLEQLAAVLRKEGQARFFCDLLTNPESCSGVRRAAGADCLERRVRLGASSEDSGSTGPTL
uniref:Uncharacterized protein n=1 Tax=Haptolina ericina TaxID=156174 RepID=A0A7S3FAL5_9EUKA